MSHRMPSDKFFGVFDWITSDAQSCNSSFNGALERTPEFNPPADERRRIKATATDGIDGVMTFGYSRYKKFYPHLPEHVHPDCFEINFCQRGVLVFKSGEREYLVKPGHVFISKPNEPHHLTTNIQGLSLYWILIRCPASRQATVLGLSPTETASLRKRLESISSPCFQVGEDICHLFQELVKAYDGPRTDMFRRVLLRSTALRILTSIIRDSQRKHQKIFWKRIQQSAQRIVAHPEQNHPIAELAQQNGLSINRFSLLFKRATGLPPHKMIIFQRLSKAKQLLSDTDTPISEISYSLGFATPRHFADQFKATFGITASEWRKQQTSPKP